MRRHIFATQQRAIEGSRLSSLATIVQQASPAGRTNPEPVSKPQLGRASALALVCLLGSCASLHQENAPVSAQRPTLSSDTATTVAGTFEVEVGGLWDPSDQVDTPVSLKYGSGVSTEVFLGWSPLFHLDTPKGRETGVGDVALGLRHRFIEESDASPSAAIQTTLKLPTADEGEGLGSGELDASFAGILTKNVEDYVVTGYYSLDVLGDPSGGTDIAHSLAIASTTPKFGRFGAFGELAGVFIPEQDDEQVFTTLGLTFTPRATLAYDVGIVIGLSDDAPDFQLVFGVTHNFGHMDSHTAGVHSMDAHESPSPPQLRPALLLAGHGVGDAL